MKGFNLRGISTIFSEKKWVFAYTVLFISWHEFDQAGFIQVLVILCPSVFALAAADKYTKRMGNEDVGR